MAVNIGPKIGLDGEKEYRSALNNIIQQQKLLNAEMQKVSSAYDTNATSIKKNKEQHELLGKAVENQQKRVDMLRAGLQDYESKAGSSATETLKMKQALAEAETELNNLQRQFKDTGPLNTWCNAVAEAGEKLQGVGQKMQDVGGMATKYLTAPIMAAGTASLKASVDFESGMAQVQATMSIQWTRSDRWPERWDLKQNSARRKRRTPSTFWPWLEWIHSRSMTRCRMF